MSDHDDDGDSGIWGGLFSSYLSFGGLYGCNRQPLSAAGRYLQTLERGDAAEITTQAHISEELEAQLRRIQIVSMRPAP